MLRLLQLPEEIWKDIPHENLLLDGVFECSNLGRVRRKGLKKCMQGKKNADRFLEYILIIHRPLTKKVELYGENTPVVIRYSVVAHRMVYKLFGPPIPPKKHLYHLNGCLDDNYIDNIGVISRRAHKRLARRLKKQGRVYYKRPYRYFKNLERKKK